MTLAEFVEAVFVPEHVALKKAELDFDAQMKSLGISEEKLAYDDVASARAREVAVKDHTPMMLAIGMDFGSS